MPSRIVITGAPGSGKTEFLTRLQSNPRYHQFVFLGELARILLEEQPSFRRDAAAFHEAIYRQQTAREEKLARRSFVSDRGTVDGFAFYPDTLSLVNTTLAAEYRRYDAVVQLGTAAVLGKEYYVADDIRCESPDEALLIEQSIRSVWEHHPDYYFVDANPDLEVKFNRFTQIMDDCIRRTQNLTDKPTYPSME